jgi:ApaG protein
MEAINFFYRITNGIRITAQPFYVAEQSQPDLLRYVFVYHIRIENVGDEPARLVWRHWYIHDSAAGESEVEGEGVVGEMPVIAPGGVHEYQSYSVLRSPSGHMEGYYEFVRDDGSRFRADVPRFLLRVHSA